MRQIPWILIAATLALTGCASAPQGFIVASDAAIAPEPDRTITHIGQAVGVTKDELFASSRQWIAETFRSSKAVIDLEDKTEGVIVGNAAIPYPKAGCAGLYCAVIADWQVRFKVRIDVKDDRFRVTFSDLELFAPASYGSFATPATRRPMIYAQEIGLARPELIALASSLAGYTSKVKTDKNW